MLWFYKKKERITDDKTYNSSGNLCIIQPYVKAELYKFGIKKGKKCLVTFKNHFRHLLKFSSNSAFSGVTLNLRLRSSIEFRSIYTTEIRQLLLQNFNSITYINTC